MLQWIAVLFKNSIFLNDIHTEYFAYLQYKSFKQEYHYGICSFRTEMQSAVFHVFFSLTPTAIDYREPNVSATMQQPSSVVHDNYNYKTQNL